ncbi:YceI family protein [Polaribacter sp. R77954]|uniref:YceI family protein n=1 Tax=Polaribacter sp. R77954 TaxID=3093870 RepID=UPI0037C69F3E
MKYKKIWISAVCLLFLILHTSAQERYITTSGKINFFSKATLEDITADNDKVSSIIDATTGDMAIKISIKNFEFKKKLMQEHFNENYLESDIYPTAMFKGNILNFNTMDENSKEFTVKGKITIHGVTKAIEIKANCIKTADFIKVSGNFMVALEDFKIKIPKIVFMKIAENIKVTFNFNHKPYKK